MNEFEFSTSQEAWASMNEYLFVQEKLITEKDQGKRVGNAMVIYDSIIHVKKLWVDPEFDFNDMFGYKIQKWVTLVKNYVDFNYLDLVTQEVRSKERKKNVQYNVTFHFSNRYSSGKDCLIALTFSRRVNLDVPVIIFNLRASEVTKRLLWDFLLVQRIAEYVYGPKQKCLLQLHCPMMFINTESFTMYHTYRDLRTLLPKGQKLEPHQQKVMESLDKFLKVNPLELTYRVHRRPVRQLQRDEHGKSLHGAKPLKAKHITLTKPTYPLEVLTQKQVKQYRKKNGLTSNIQKPALH
jgi:hypothetical protein